MTKKLIALLLILTLIFSMAACKSSDEEESAVAGEIVQDSSDDNDNNDGSGSENQNNNQNDNQNDSQNDNNDKTPSDSTPDNNNEDENNPPPVSTEGKYKVKFDYGYQDKEPFETRTDGDLSDPEAVRRGYELDGWYNGNQKWDFSDTVTSNMTLTAKWVVITYTITYDGEGATIPSGMPTSYTVNDHIDLKPATKTGKAFSGWSINNGSETIVSNTITIGTTGNLTLKPVWDENAIVIGKYEQDGNTENGEEPIVWIKLKEQNGKALVITRDIIDAKAFDETNSGSSIKWRNSPLRNWLNNTFYKKAFIGTEKNAIIETEVSTPGQYDGTTSKDFVFILSVEEAKELITSNSSRRAKVTKFAENNGAQNSATGGWWWLRTKVGNYATALVEQDGNIRTLGYNSMLTTIGVRPAMWVDLSKLG